MILTQLPMGNVVLASINVGLGELYKEPHLDITRRGHFKSAGCHYEATPEYISTLARLLRVQYPPSPRLPRAPCEARNERDIYRGVNGRNAGFTHFVDKTGVGRYMSILHGTVTRLVAWPTDRFGIKDYFGKPVDSYIGVQSEIRPYYPRVTIFAAHRVYAAYGSNGMKYPSDAHEAKIAEDVSHEVNGYVNGRLGVPIAGREHLQEDFIFDLVGARNWITLDR